MQDGQIRAQSSVWFSLKGSLSRAIEAVLPVRPWTHLQSIRARNQESGWLKNNGVLDLARRFSDYHGLTVLHGPFKGLKYPERAILSRNTVPKLLGSYECELHNVIESALRSKYRRVIDVGSAEGYYAVGLALKAGCPVMAFDADPREVRLCREMARLNGLQNLIHTGHWCSPEKLRAAIESARCFVMSDCEGYELELFDQLTVAQLIRSDVLIETHGSTYGPLLERFSKTHAVQTVVAVDRSTSDHPELSCLASDGDRAVAEYRLPGQRWLFARSVAA